MKVFRWLSTIIVLALLVAACTPLSNAGTPGAEQTPAADASPLICPFAIQVAIQGDTNCQTPRSLRVAYGVESLMQRGYWVCIETCSLFTLLSTLFLTLSLYATNAYIPGRLRSVS